MSDWGDFVRMGDGAPSDFTLTYTLHNTSPIELLDLTSSLLAIDEQYQRFMRDQGDEATDDYRLYVREVRTATVVDCVAFRNPARNCRPRVRPFTQVPESCTH